MSAREFETLGTAWNGYISRCARISLRRFAAVHGVPYETWRREYHRDAACRTIRSGNRWIYSEYDVNRALALRNGGNRTRKAGTHYTRAYASCEKGAIENCNRLVRRWLPK